MTNLEAADLLDNLIGMVSDNHDSDYDEALSKGRDILKSGHWIPVSERLPLLMGSYKISDDVLVTNGYENYLGYLVERKGKIFWHYYGSDIEVGINDNDDDVTAWMPLPEPYKPQESEDKE
jgi:hypothetical protein